MNDTMHADWMLSARQGYYIAHFDTKTRYARSLLGPFWITVSSSIFIVSVGIVWSALFGQTISEQLPFISVSYIAWVFFQGALLESTATFVGSASYVRDRGISWMAFCWAVFFRHGSYLVHSLVVPLVTLLVFAKGSLTGLVMALPGIVLFVTFVLLIILPVAVTAARFRDVKPILESITVMMMLVSPVMWAPKSIRAPSQIVVDLNPIAHLLAVWRDPLLYGEIPVASYFVCLALIAVLAALNVVAFRQLPRVAFWV